MVGMSLKRKWVLFPECSNYNLDYNVDFNADFKKNIRKDFKLYLVNELENKTQMISDIKDDSEDSVGEREIIRLVNEIDNIYKWLDMLKND